MAISDDYVLGIIEGGGNFTFSTTKYVSRKSGEVFIKKIPAFMLQMHERDEELVRSVRDHLKLGNKIYAVRKPAIISNGKSYKRGNSAILSVREIGALKNIIMPFFAKRLIGYRGKQFREWIEIIGKDNAVPESYKIIYRLYVARFDRKGFL